MGHVRRPKPNVAPNPARIKNVILPARRTARKPVSKPGTAKQPARVNVRMGMQKNSGFPLNEIERCAFAHRSLFWLVVLDMKPDQEWSRFKFLDCMMK